MKRPKFQEGLNQFSVAHLLYAIVAMFVIAPFVDRWKYGSIIESAVFTIAMVAAISAIGGRRHTLVVAAILAVPAVATRWLGHVAPNLLPHDVHLIVAIVFVAYVIFHLFRFVITAPAVTTEVLCAAISIYLLFAVACSFAYALVLRADPTAFRFTNPADANSGLNGFTGLYLSLQVLTTITFGDIVPVSNVARMMTLTEATVGVFYLATLIARLVGLYSSTKSRIDS